MARRRWTVTAHLDRARVTNQLKGRRCRRLGTINVDDNRSSRGRGRHRNRDHGTARLQILGFYVQHVIEIGAAMRVNCRAVLVVIVVVRVIHGVNVECEALRLEREQGQRRKGREGPEHSPSVWKQAAGVKPRVDREQS